MAPHQHKSRLSQRNKPFKGGSRGPSSRRKHLGTASNANSTSSKASSAAPANKKQRRAALAAAARARRVLAAEAPPLLILVVSLHEDTAVMQDTTHAPVTHLLPEYLRRDLAADQGNDTFTHTHKQLPSRVKFVAVRVPANSPSHLTQLADLARVSDHILLIPPQAPHANTPPNPAMVKILLATTGHSISSHPPSILPADSSFITALSSLSLPTAALQPGNAPLRTVLTRAFTSYSASSTAASWRSAIPYMMVDSISTRPAADAGTQVVLTGVLRGCKLGANRLVHVSGVGTFAAGEIAADGVVVAVRDERGDDVQSEGEGMDEMMKEQTFPNEDDYQAEANARKQVTKKKRPKGWSDYQSAWIAEDDNDQSESDRESASDDIDMDNDTHPMQATNGSAVPSEELQAPSEEDQDPDSDQEKPIDEEEVERIRSAAREDVQFPDEVDIGVNQVARKRLEKFRGLKSLRTSPWDPKELLPEDYSRIFQFADFAATKKRILKQEAAESSLDSAPFADPGQVIDIVLLDVLAAEVSQMKDAISRGDPLIASGMHAHTGKRTVAHARIKRTEFSGTDEMTVKSKDVVEMQCGFVRFKARPVYSEDNGNSSKHKMERFLQAGRFVVASFYGPGLFPPLPVLIFKHPAGCTVDDPARLIATGSLMSPDPDRIVLKRIILTGYPFKIHKSRVVVRFMFFNRGDIKWFQPVELWTKYGRTGRILEPLGTHGYMKCHFDSPLGHHDTVCMSLYKRVYPKRVSE